jgi:glutaredoxin
MLRFAVAFGLVLAVAPAAALYKVVGPDGRVTYTDRPPADAQGRVTTLGANGSSSEAADISLPYALGRVAARYPVTLYAAADCPPCDSARTLLQQRGIPYSERRVATEDDAAALQRLVGGRTLPSLTIGTQALRGFSASEWTSYLDAAGYPRESRLPSNWQAPVPAPLVERATAPAAAAAPAAPDASTAPARTADGGIRF